MFQFLPLIFTFMLASFPAGLVIYWTWNNLLSIAQQWLIMRRGRKPGSRRRHRPAGRGEAEEGVSLTPPHARRPVRSGRPRTGRR